MSFSEGGSTASASGSRRPSPRAAQSTQPGVKVARPEPERRSSGRKLAAAIAKPLFRRTSSQTGPTSAPLLKSSSASVSTATSRTVKPGKTSRPSSSHGSGPPSPAAGPVPSSSRRPWTASSSTRGTGGTGTIQSTPSPGTETLHQAPFPSPHFAQFTPTHNPPNPFAPPIDCVLALTNVLSQPITMTLSQLIPLNLITANSGFPANQILGNTLAGASTVSLATTVLSEAATTSTTHQTSASSVPTPASSSNWNHSVSPYGGCLPTSAFIMNEQLAASSLNLPTTSIGTVWRIAKAIEWLSENGAVLNNLASQRANPTTPRPSAAVNINLGIAPPPSNPSLETTFDFASLVQSCMDVYAALAAEKGVEMVFFHGTRQQYETTPHRSPGSEGLQGIAGRYNLEDVQEAYVKADERGIGLGLLTILKQVLDETRAGSSIEIGVAFNLTTPPNSPADDEDDEDDDNDGDDQSVPKQPKGTYFCTVEITHTFSSSPSSESSQAHSTHETLSFQTHRPEQLNPSVSAALLQHIHLSLITHPPKFDTQTFKVTCALPQGISPPPAPMSESNIRRRKSLEQGRELTMPELLRFIDTSLRGKKAALFAQESSTFAKYLSHHLATWGLDVNHISTSLDDEPESAHAWETKKSGAPMHLGRLDSGFGGSDSTSPPYAPLASPAVGLMADPIAAYGQSTGSSPAQRSTDTGSVTSPPLDPHLSFIIVDDDIATLKKQLISVRNNAPTVQLHNALLAKRPQLQSRRTRSSQALQRVNQVTVSIIHFTSLTNYRQIKEIVHTVLKNASPMFPLPEVLVVPKPVGPRRLLTTLYNAVRRPALDPAYVPIATSPSSPGGHYFFAGGRPSPAPSHSNANDFDVAAGQMLAQQRQADLGLSAAVSQSTGPRTPPVPGQASPSSPSPVSPDALEYFSKSAVELGSSASQGIIIQSLDGRPTGLFFQPRAASLHEKAESVRTGRKSIGETGQLDEASSPGGSIRPKASPSPGHTATIASGQELPAIVIPEHMDIGSPNRILTISPAPLTAEAPVSFGQRTTEAMAPAPSAAPVSRSSSLHKADSSSSVDSLDSGKKSPDTGPPKSEPTSPRSPTSPSPARAQIPATTPTSTTPPAPVTSPTLSTDSPSTSIRETSQAPLVNHPPSIRATGRKSSGRIDKVRKPPRRPTGTLVPPINVLIVEDNPINQIILSTFLKRKGIKYSVANNGQEAVDAWKAGDFHLVLMDIQLPVKDGIEATQEIRALERANNTHGFVSTPTHDIGNPLASPTSSVTSPYELPVIIVALTASSLQSDRVNALAAGCNDFLTKPVSLQWLNQKLVEWGSMAYLSGFSHKRRATLMTPKDTLAQASQALATGAAPPDDKEAFKAKLRAMMTRKPPGLSAPTPKPKVTALAEGAIAANAQEVALTSADDASVPISAQAMPDNTAAAGTPGATNSTEAGGDQQTPPQAPPL